MPDEIQDKIDRLERQLQWSVDSDEKLRLLREINEIEVGCYDSIK